MSDRELLELAAKACGELTPQWYGNDAYLRGVLSRWDPLTDDGDALRLAVRLGIEVQPNERGCSTLSRVAIGTRIITELCSVTGATPEEATRRCIVKAAAGLASEATP